MSISDSKAAEPDEVPADPRVRLQRYLAACGLGSRRACEQYISDGRVTIDGQTVAVLGATVGPGQVVALDGQRLRTERKKYYLLNKPPGYLCTSHDPAGRRRALDLLPADGPRLFTVGRLDEHSTGLLIVTNDGDLAQQLAHPRHQIFRTYHVQVAGHPKREVLQSLKDGLHFSDGRFRVRGVKSLKKIGQSTWLEILLSEGHNRELRRLLARVGHKVLKLTRVAFGPIRIGRLRIGEHRELTKFELDALRGLVARIGSGAAAASGRRPARGKRNARPSKRTGAARSGAGRRGPPKRPRR